jgi:hypothetical protein
MSNVKVAASALLCILTLNATVTTAVVAACEGGGGGEEEAPNFFVVSLPLLYNKADQQGEIEIFDGGGLGSLVNYDLKPGTALKITSGSSCIKEYKHAESPCFVGILSIAKPKTPPTKYTEEFLTSDSDGSKYGTLIKVEL